MNGNIGVMKTYVIEITDDTNRGVGFSYMSVSWSIGSVIAPIFGGMLSNPVSKYPRFFKQGTVFDKFPYFLPCLCCVILLIFSVVICTLFMKETRVWSSVTDDNKPMKMGEIADRKSKNDTDYALLDRSEHIGGGDVELTEAARPQGVSVADTSASSNAMTVTPKRRCNNDDDDIDSAFDDRQQLNGDGNLPESDGADCSTRDNRDVINFDEEAGCLADDGKTISVPKGTDVDEEDELLECTCCTCRSAGSLVGEIDGSGNSMKTISPLQRRNVVLACCNYAVLCMAYILFDETLPLYLKLDVDEGGFSFQSTDIGSLLSLPGVFMIGFAYAVLPRIAKKSKKEIFRISVIVCALHIMLWPLVGTLHQQMQDLEHPTRQRRMDLFVFYPVLFVLIMIKSIAGTVAFMAVNMQIGHSVFDEDLGTVNGFGQSLAAVSRGLGPAIGGFLWSISVSVNFVYLNFMAMVCMLLLNIYIGNLIPISLDFKKTKAKNATIVDTDGVDEGEGEEEVNFAGEF